MSKLLNLLGAGLTAAAVTAAFAGPALALNPQPLPPGIRHVHPATATSTLPAVPRPGAARPS